ncbi:hypothetical protein TRFO_25502 [Tritrichomonas foetus]|uniref:TPR Domain containing protein n=1 Tax=Tritrichomonas foetus TaxID=1144522 RepID=A0A1J4K653_9EUKA|nr:hypothetical protein TRFO_25502 [Tritrichomonas foetus]|eukprot:OHT06474.1 hypothetical protein TRFO_25502 [Tritrichomonas foetus]
MSEQDASYESSSFSSAFVNLNTSANNKRAPRPSNFETQSTIHRLSRFPDRFNAKPKLPSSEDPSDPTPFATSYFKANPEAEDLSSPEEKLENLTKLLEGGGLSTSEKFTALSQQKTMRYLIYGDDSIEMLRSFAALGFFYNENKRYESAIRNLENAHKMETLHPLEEADSFLIALETAEAHLSIENNKQKHVSSADSILSPFQNYDVEDPMLKIRFDLAQARILENKKLYEDAESKFKEALEQVDQSNQDETLAKLYNEVGDCCVNADDLESAQEFYEKSQKIFASLEMEEEANIVDDKLNNVKSQIQMENKNSRHDK